MFRKRKMLIPLKRPYPGYTVTKQQAAIDDDTPDPDVVAPLKPSSREYRLRGGHFSLFLGFVVMVALYIVLRILAQDPSYLDEGASLSALFYVVALALFTGHIFGGLAFFLDFYRIPAIVVVALWVFGVYTVAGTDHYFDLNPARPTALTVQQIAERQPVLLDDLLDHANWEIPKGKDGKRTLVVVTAAGGGIQASAWTAKVLTGLDEELPNFSESVVVISSVSGGSVGTLLYVGGRGERGGASRTLGAPIKPMTISPVSREQINALAQGSSLEATGWGLAFYDTLRVISPVQHWWNPEVDRGYTLEKLWNQRLQKLGASSTTDLRLLDWVQPVREGRMPAVVFNSTIVQTGQRMLISPVVTEPLPEKPEDDQHCKEARTESVASAVEFFRRYPHADPRVTTATRLSATFSYVSPVCRPLTAHIPADLCQPLYQKYQYHMADGGYSDNEGLMTALKWIGQLVESEVDRRAGHKSAKFDRILLVRIIPFPDTLAPDQVAKGGLSEVIGGPLSTLGAARVASQEERGRLELALTRQSLRQMQWEKLKATDRKPLTSPPAWKVFSQTAPTMGTRHQPAGDSGIPAANPGLIDIDVAVFQFKSKVGHIVPLSWKLTPVQQKRIGDCWDEEILPELQGKRATSNPADGSLPLKTLKDWFTPDRLPPSV